MKTETIVQLPIVKKDPWLEPNAEDMLRRYDRYRERLSAIGKECGSLTEYANGYFYFGFQYDDALRGWWFREWLPGAKDVYLFGDFNGWQRTQLPLKKDGCGVWSVFLPDETYGERLVHGSKVKMLVHGDNGWLERIPSYIRRVVQDEHTKDYTGQLWAPAEPFDWRGDSFDIASVGSLLIYECHVGMAQEKEGVGTYCEFIKTILPHIKKAGYNTIQLMAVAEHPYYGSFGYHVSNFFAPSSRFGTPEELKALVRKAHTMGLAVIMDLVHSHYVKNINEGLNELDGTDHLYSPAGKAGDHPYWDSKLFDYGKEQVRHFLLSNIKYWLTEFHFDGFRFDGVTSMIYYHHGYTEFDSREKYFSPEVNEEALCYLTLANRLIHDLYPHAVTIAEDVSGMPGMCAAAEEGGVGFDYRLGMAVPDFWIKLLKEVPDEQWDIWQMWNMMTDRLPYVKTVAYCESHDQALVGDQTIAFRLMNKQMYTDMNRAAQNVVIDRGMALHKMIRLFTISLAGQAYLNFMGNEFGHPEWIDFPREGNGWSYAHARRLWSLAENGFLRYSYLGAFDRAMLKLVRKYDILGSGYAYNHLMDTANQTLAFSHGTTVFVFNWHPRNSIPDYAIPVPEPGRYRIVLTSDAPEFGGYGRIDPAVKAFSFSQTDSDGSTRPYIRIYNLCRSALVLTRMNR
ncbi:1,4-alpha-glucan-branching enzyme [Alistipes sp. dk3620]|uniref:alpha-amylase family glycosyl hydrolase n=1 Tax=unclassified Alistipes TaxID=2608932 RepID=UPI001296D85D|nr:MULTISPECIES: alpha-amylase family glycosyl hydrolase [unclassified Alistipes]MQX28458.1 1,4-alpha-glucan-branching enzyme [Alistipes sp. dk3620]QGA22623.1 1,4-alpha-glucan-branching enzyme [Alistipes sp. dk3624]HIV59575.1 alpha amylase C-terminal domain-containing protein [Candidatus Alistipes pullistercoris]